MAFTAGSVELAKAEKLGNILSNMALSFGLTAMSGITGAQTIEQRARELGFGITGLTTGGGFPPFGTPGVASTHQRSGVHGPLTSALQNPRGETAANGFNLGEIQGRTVGLFVKKFVRDGADFARTIYGGVTLAQSLVSGSQFSAQGPFMVHQNDTVVFPDASYRVSVGGRAGFGFSGSFSVFGSPNPYATAAAFDITTVGVTRDTRGVAGASLGGFRTGAFDGFTATLFFGIPTSGGSTGFYRLA